MNVVNLEIKKYSLSITSVYTAKNLKAGNSKVPKLQSEQMVVILEMERDSEFAQLLKSRKVRARKSPEGTYDIGTARWRSAGIKRILFSNSYRD